MNKIVEILKNSPALYIATVNSENKPNNRPFALALEEDGKLYFSTSSETSAYNDLQTNPYAAITTMSNEQRWVRINAKCSFVEDIGVKETVIDKNKFLKSRFETASNPVFRIFTLDNGIATIYDYSNNPSISYNF